MSNALLLLYVMHWNKLACVERMQDIAVAMGVNVSGLSVNDAADQAYDDAIVCRSGEVGPAQFSSR